MIVILGSLYVFLLEADYDQKIGLCVLDRLMLKRELLYIGLSHLQS